MSDLLPAIAFCVSLCIAVGTFTNRTFGHATFFRCHDGCADTVDTLARQSESNGNNSNNDCGSGSREEYTEAESLCSAKAEDGEVSRVDLAAGDECHTAAIDNTGVIEHDVFFSEAPLSVLEHVGSFLFPAELIDAAPVSVDFSRTIAESCVVWREQCSRAFAGVGRGCGHFKQEAHGSKVTAVGEAWLEETLSRHVSLSVPCGGMEAENAAAKSASAAADGCISEVPAARDDIVAGDEDDVRDSATGSTVHDRNASVSQDRGAGNVDRDEKKPWSHGVESVTFDTRNHSDDMRSPSRQQRQQQRLSSPSSSSRSWKAAFFIAHSTRPQQMLEEGKIIGSNAAATSASTAGHLNNGDVPSSSSSPSCLLVIVGGKLHDLTEFRDSHPGGVLILEEYAFTDATHAFERFFHSREARRMARQFVVWDGAAVMGRSGTLWQYSEDGGRLKRASEDATAEKRDGEQMEGATGPVLSSSGARVLHQAIRRWTTAR